MSASSSILGGGPLAAGPGSTYLRPAPYVAAPPPPSPPPTVPDGALVYPSTLPGPSSISTTTAERRRQTGRPGPWAIRSFERERRGTLQAAWVLNPAEASTFRQWWEEDLIYGAGWFFATWPSLQGLTEQQYAFTEPPKWEHAGKGIWRVSAPLEFRAASLP